MPSSPASRRTGGNRSPGVRTPPEMSARIWLRSCAKGASPEVGSMCTGRSSVARPGRHGEEDRVGPVLARDARAVADVHLDQARGRQGRLALAAVEAVVTVEVVVVEGAVLVVQVGDAQVATRLEHRGETAQHGLELLDVVHDHRGDDELEAVL